MFVFVFVLVFIKIAMECKEFSCIPSSYSDVILEVSMSGRKARCNSIRSSAVPDVVSCFIAAGAML